MSLVPDCRLPLHSQRSDFNQKAIRVIGDVHPLFLGMAQSARSIFETGK
jgi:hypothetical protein